MNFKNKGYNEPSQMERDQKFLDWCVVNAERFNSYSTIYTRKLYQDYDWLYNQIVTLNKSCKQVAEENGWTVRLLKRWMRILEINKRAYQNLKQMSDSKEEK